MKRVVEFLKKDLQKFLSCGFRRDYVKIITAKNYIIIKPTEFYKVNEKIILKNDNDIIIILFTDKLYPNYLPIVSLNKNFDFWITKVRKFN